MLWSAGRSAAWLARLPWEQEVTSSNLVAPIDRARWIDRAASVPRPPCVAVCPMSDLELEKSEAARAAADLVQNGMVVGLGTGSTASCAVQILGRRIREQGLQIVGVATSLATAELAESVGIPLGDLNHLSGVDISIDGADEVDPAFRLIKGRGGALLHEKIVASAARRRVIVVSSDKQVEHLGRHAPVPVEVSSFGLKHTEHALRNQGASTTLRRTADGTPTRPTRAT